MMSTTYEILIKHKPGECPELPAPFSYQNDASSRELWPCPLHLIWRQVCTIESARWHVEQAKQHIRGLQTLTLLKNGYATERDRWQYRNGQWQRDW
jgi:hypothetical protein